MHARPDLVLLDYQIPAGNAAIVYERLLASGDGFGIPVIFMSALADAEKNLPKHPATRFLPKPIRYETLSAVIRELLGA